MAGLNNIIVDKLKANNLTISFMESCTGGLLANQITNCDGSSEIFKGSLVTYSNEFKEKFGVEKETIDKYSVYSAEVAKEMATNASAFANSDIGVGVTGRIANENIDEVFASVYLKKENINIDYVFHPKAPNRILKKEKVSDYIFEAILENLKKFYNI